MLLKFPKETHSYSYLKRNQVHIHLLLYKEIFHAMKINC